MSENARIALTLFIAAGAVILVIALILLAVGISSNDTEQFWLGLLGIGAVGVGAAGVSVSGKVPRDINHVSDVGRDAGEAAKRSEATSAELDAGIGDAQNIVADIKQNLERANAELGSLETSIERIDNTTEQLTNVLGELGTTVERVEGNVRGLESTATAAGSLAERLRRGVAIGSGDGKPDG
jgi:flagellin-like hook-associated protein FlgL